jgi:hypothetical protein
MSTITTNNLKTVVERTPATLCVSIFGLFNNAFSSSDCTALNVMINENYLEKMFKEMVMA